MSAKPIKPGPGAAAQLLEHAARRLAGSDQPRDRYLATCIGVVLEQRTRLLTEKFGPERDFSREPRLGGKAP